MYNFLWRIRFFFIAFGGAGLITLLPVYNYHPAQDVVLAIDVLALLLGVILHKLGFEHEEEY